MLAALRSGILGLGPFARRFEAEFAAFCGTRARRHRLERHRRAAPAGARRRHRPGRRGHHGADLVRGLGQRDALRARDAGLRRRRSRDVRARSRRRSRRPSRRARARILPVHVFGYPCDMEALGALAEKHSLAIIEDACEAVGSERSGQARRRPRQPGGVRLLPQQADDDRRGRHGHDRRRRARRAAALASPTRAAPTRATGSSTTSSASTTAWTSSRPPSGSRRPSASTRSSARAPRSPPATTTCSAAIDGVTIPAPTAPGRRALVVRLRRAARRGDRPRRRDGRPAGARRGLQAVPARGAPAAVLSQPRAPARASFPSPRRWRAPRSRCRSTRASRPTTRPTSPPASPTCSAERCSPRRRSPPSSRRRSPAISPRRRPGGASPPGSSIPASHAGSPDAVARRTANRLVIADRAGRRAQVVYDGGCAATAAAATPSRRRTPAATPCSTRSPTAGTPICRRARSSSGQAGSSRRCGSRRRAAAVRAGRPGGRLVHGRRACARGRRTSRSPPHARGRPAGRDACAPSCAASP